HLTALAPLHSTSGRCATFHVERDKQARFHLRHIPSRTRYDGTVTDDTVRRERETQTKTPSLRVDPTTEPETK
ncbi:jg15884, partial [Pararge aegeria aegeria]